MQKKSHSPHKSERFPLENFKNGFCGLLMRRLYTVVKWTADTSEEMLLFINLIDRTNKETITQKKLIYGGVSFLKTLLERYDHSSDKHKREVAAAIDGLSLVEIEFKKSIEGGHLYEEFERGDLGLNDAKVKKLTKYFKKHIKKGTFENEGQKLEYPIIEYFLSVEKDYYLSLPLIQFGDFDGVVHIICSAKDKRIFESKVAKKALIRQFSLEYEGLLLDWDLVGGNIQKESELPNQLEYLTSTDYEQSSKTNPIFRELQYRSYYLDSMSYFVKRIEHSDSVPSYIKDEHRKRAIISILIDSYAHNISAHSLTVLKWWFQQRASSTAEIEQLAEEIGETPEFDEWGKGLRDYLSQRFDDTYKKKDIETGIRKDVARWIHIVERQMKKGKYLPVRDQFFPLAEQLHPLFKFLLEKGAFWSGITRDQQFGGEIRDLQDVLWNDFINNPLYLGTIAYSEGITKLNIHLRFYSGRQYKGDRMAFKREYSVAKSDTGQVLTGHFATIDVGGLKEKAFEHPYVVKGSLYEMLSDELRKCEVFFPGGVVGKHSFFTLIENEIRNVKHFPESDLVQMRKNGLDLYIGIRPGSLSGVESQLPKSEAGKQLYKIGIWIGHKTKLYDNEEHLITKRLKGLKLDIVTDDSHQARLGGNFQDKICSAMLFNNTFISVERQENDRDRHYYPWVRSAYSRGLESNNETEFDFEVQARNLKKAEVNLQNRKKDKNVGNHSEVESHPELGYFKKYFHLWQGKQLYHLHKIGLIELENLARFKMIMLQDPSWKNRVRAEGVIRVLEESHTSIEPEEAYHHWLRKWLKGEQYRIRFKRAETTVGHLLFDQDSANYYSQNYYMDILEPEKQEQYADYSLFDLEFAHGKKVRESENILSIRSHGILAQYFFRNLENINDFDQASIGTERICELLEVIQTKICIFDNRVAERIEQEEKRTFLNRQLKCGIYEESVDKWELVKKEGLSNYHFIIMHLSFMESLKDDNGKRYGEKGIVRFLDDQVKKHLSDNCIFVVTTGRGREQWWRELQQSNFTACTTFRPVEMLIEAVENGRMMNDDINLKYNLVKVLFGS